MTTLIWTVVGVLAAPLIVRALQRLRIRCDTRIITGGDLVAARALRIQQGKPFALDPAPKTAGEKP